MWKRDSEEGDTLLNVLETVRDKLSDAEAAEYVEYIKDQSDARFVIASRGAATKEWRKTFERDPSEFGEAKRLALIDLWCILTKQMFDEWLTEADEVGPKETRMRTMVMEMVEFADDLAPKGASEALRAKPEALRAEVHRAVGNLHDVAKGPGMPPYRARASMYLLSKVWDDVEGSTGEELRCEDSFENMDDCRAAKLSELRMLRRRVEAALTYDAGGGAGPRRVKLHETAKHLFTEQTYKEMRPEILEFMQLTADRKASREPLLRKRFEKRSLDELFRRLLEMTADTRDLAEAMGPKDVNKDRCIKALENIEWSCTRTWGDTFDEGQDRERWVGRSSAAVSASKEALAAELRRCVKDPTAEEIDAVFAEIDRWRALSGDAKCDAWRDIVKASRDKAKATSAFKDRIAVELRVCVTDVTAEEIDAVFAKREQWKNLSSDVDKCNAWIKIVKASRDIAGATSGIKSAFELELRVCLKEAYMRDPSAEEIDDVFAKSDRWHTLPPGKAKCEAWVEIVQASRDKAHPFGHPDFDVAGVKASLDAFDAFAYKLTVEEINKIDLDVENWYWLSEAGRHRRWFKITRLADCVASFPDPANLFYLLGSDAISDRHVDLIWKNADKWISLDPSEMCVAWSELLTEAKDEDDTIPIALYEIEGVFTRLLFPNFNNNIPQDLKAFISKHKPAIQYMLWDDRYNWFFKVGEYTHLKIRPADVDKAVQLKVYPRWFIVIRKFIIAKHEFQEALAIFEKIIRDTTPDNGKMLWDDRARWYSKGRESWFMHWDELLGGPFFNKIKACKGNVTKDDSDFFLVHY